MTEFGRRQYYSASDRNRVETQGTMRWLAGTVAAIALIAGSFLGYRVFYLPADQDPLLKSHESFEAMVDRHASEEELFQEYASLDTRSIPIAFDKKVYKIPRNYLVDLNRPGADPKETTFEIHVLLPDLVPRTANTADKFLKPPHYGGLRDQMNATIRGGQEELDWSKRRLEWDRWCAEKGQGAFRQVDSGYRLCEASNSDLFLKDTTEGPLIFSCNKITDKNPGCTVAGPTGAQYGVLVLEFSRKYVYQADEIRKRFLLLLDSFVEK